MDLTGLGSIADFAGGIMDRFWPKMMTEAEKAQAQQGLIDAMEQRELARDAFRAEIIKAELAQGDDYTKRARPTVVYAGLVFIFMVHVVLPMASFWTNRQMPSLSLPDNFWLAWGGVVSVWMVGRSAERMGSGASIVKTITGGK